MSTYWTMFLITLVLCLVFISVQRDKFKDSPPGAIALIIGIASLLWFATWLVAICAILIGPKKKEPVPAPPTKSDMDEWRKKGEAKRGKVD